MKKSILLIRHAQSANNALPEAERVSDPALTPLGEQQAELLAERLLRTPQPIGELYCSPFKRSLDTTLPISRRLGLLPTIRADIYEQGGCYSGYEVGKKRGEPGMCCRTLAELYPQWIIDSRITDRGWNADRDYESFHEVQQRAKEVFQWLTDQWHPVRPGALAALVIHADFKRVLTSELLRCGSWPGAELPVWNTSVSQLHYDGSKWHLVEWNCAEHLPLELRTPIDEFD